MGSGNAFVLRDWTEVPVKDYCQSVDFPLKNPQPSVLTRSHGANTLRA